MAFTTAGDVASDAHTDCDRTTLFLVISSRRGAPTSRGPTVGDPVEAFMAAYPDHVTAGSGDAVTSMSLGTGSERTGGIGARFDAKNERVVGLAAGFFEFRFG